MNIGTVESFPTAKIAQGGQPESGPESGVAGATGEPVSGTLPKQETSVAQSARLTYEVPQDVVEVHQDPETKDQIIEYLDKARNVVFQVPSSEEVSVERGIAQDFQQAAKLRASADVTATGKSGR